MSGAELKTLREALGLPVSWLADRAGVRERTANYWESGKSQIPEDVAKLVTDLDKAFDERVSLAVRDYGKYGAQDPEIVLVRYRTDEDLRRYMPEFADLPATCHAALLNRAKKALEQAGASVRIVYMQPDAYQAWLGTRTDAPPLRAAWAASLSATSSSPPTPSCINKKY